MIEALTGRYAVQNALSADYYYALGVEPCRKLATDYLRVAVCIFKNVDFYKFPCVKTVGKAFKHIFAYSFLAYLTYGV